jgi:predicted transcriptional regulator
MRRVLMELPEETTLGEIVGAARSNPQLEPVLKEMSIRQLIDIAVERPRPEPALDSEESGADLPISAAVIRRRSDVPDGDITLLKVLAEKGALSETQICRSAKLSAEQLRLILRGVRGKGYVHAEGSGNKRKLKITRAGSAYLRKKTGQGAPSKGRRRRRR